VVITPRAAAAADDDDDGDAGDVASPAAEAARSICTTSPGETPDALQNLPMHAHRKAL